MQHISEILKQMGATDPQRIGEMIGTSESTPTPEKSPRGNAKSYKSEQDEWREKIIPYGYRNCSFSTFKGSAKTIEPLRAYAQTWPPSNLIFYGPCGSGKTHLAVAILQEQIDNGHWLSIWFVSATDLLMEIKETFNDESTISESDVIAKYTEEIDFLVIDDLGAEFVTEWVIATFYRIIDRRFRQGLPTLVTTNLTNYEITERFGPRIASRLSAYKLVLLQGRDARKNANGQ